MNEQNNPGTLKQAHEAWRLTLPSRSALDSESAAFVAGYRAHEAQRQAGQDAEIARLKAELARPESLAVSWMRGEIAALRQALSDIATTVMPSTNDEEHDALHDCIASAQGALAASRGKESK